MSIQFSPLSLLLISPLGDAARILPLALCIKDVISSEEKPFAFCQLLPELSEIKIPCVVEQISRPVLVKKIS